MFECRQKLGYSLILKDIESQNGNIFHQKKNQKRNLKKQKKKRTIKQKLKIILFSFE